MAVRRPHGPAPMIRHWIQRVETRCERRDAATQVLYNVSEASFSHVPFYSTYGALA